MSIARQSGDLRSGRSQEAKLAKRRPNADARKQARRSVNGILVTYSRALQQTLRTDSESFLDQVVSRSDAPD